MKKLIFTLIGFSFIFLSACNTNNSVPSANLSQIEVDGIKIDDNISSVSLENYTTSTRFRDGDGIYNYEEVRIETVDDVITKITATVGSIPISINGNETCMTYDDVVQLLGTEGIVTWYDREQGLRQAQYSDDDIGVNCSFVYADSSKQLVWLILEKA